MAESSSDNAAANSGAHETQDLPAPATGSTPPPRADSSAGVPAGAGTPPDAVAASDEFTPPGKAWQSADDNHDGRQDTVMVDLDGDGPLPAHPAPVYLVEDPTTGRKVRMASLGYEPLPEPEPKSPQQLMDEINARWQAKIARLEKDRGWLQKRAAEADDYIAYITRRFRQLWAWIIGGGVVTFICCAYYLSMTWNIFWGGATGGVDPAWLDEWRHQPEVEGVLDEPGTEDDAWEQLAQKLREARGK